MFSKSEEINLDHRDFSKRTLERFDLRFFSLLSLLSSPTLDLENDRDSRLRVPSLSTRVNSRRNSKFSFRLEKGFEKLGHSRGEKGVQDVTCNCTFHVRT